MHYRLEIIMPPTDDVEKAVTDILAPFDENLEGDEASGHSFWDWWVIGGRWAGSKLEEKLDGEKINAFRAKLAEMGVTVSGLQAGKQELKPESQISMVDALWVEMFPDSGIAVCPLFAHSNDQYKSSSLLPGDVCKLSELPPVVKCSHMIIAGPNYDNSGLQAVYMIQDQIWNGVTHVDTTWDSTVSMGLSMAAEKMAHYKEDYRRARTPNDDWLVVTVDYHS